MQGNFPERFRFYGKNKSGAKIPQDSRKEWQRPPECNKRRVNSEASAQDSPSPSSPSALRPEVWRRSPTLLKALPPKSGMAFVLIQHLEPTHESALTSLLSKATSMPVVEVSDGIAVEPNHVYVIPPNKEHDHPQGNPAAGASHRTPPGRNTRLTISP